MFKIESSNNSLNSLTDLEPDISTLINLDENLETNTPESSDNKKRRGRRPLRRNIMNLLIIYPTMSVTEITDFCGLDEKGKNKYSYTWRQMKDLKERGYIEKKLHFGPNDPRGKGPSYSIKKDLRVLSLIYHDPEFKDLQSDMQTSNWIPEFIIEGRFDFLDKTTKRDVKRMLMKSGKFFELSLDYQMSTHLLIHLKRLFIEPISTSQDTELHNSPLTQYYISKVAVYDLFIYCMFKENFENQIKHQISVEDQNFLDKMVIRRNQLKKEIDNYHTSIRMSELLIGILKIYHENSDQIPKTLLDNFLWYGMAVDRSKKEGFLDPKLRSQPYKIFEEIMSELGTNSEKRSIKFP